MTASQQFTTGSGRRVIFRALRRVRLAAALAVLVALAAAPASRAQTFGTLADLGTVADNAQGPSPLVQASDGTFYATTSAGGAYGFGTAFKMDTAGNVSVVHDFGATATDGRNPASALALAKDGTLFGTTTAGGANGLGTAFKIDPTGVLTVIHSFGAGSDGASPASALIRAPNGYFYGTTPAGGTYHLGTAYKMDTNGNVSVLHSFGGVTGDGQRPLSGLLFAKNGVFYGTTSTGGANGLGAVYSMNASGSVTVLHSCGAPSGDGASPNSALFQASDGALYGTTVAGGAYGYGTAFKTSYAGAVTVLHSFGATPTEGQSPTAPFSQGKDGFLYSTTVAGGAYESGTLFRMDTTGTTTILHSFGEPGSIDGRGPTSTVLFAADRSLYGVCSAGGSSGGGTVYRIKRGQGFDANNDGYCDLLFRDSTSGAITLWEMNGFQILSKAFITQTEPSQWQIVGVGDFNGDGASDVLWRNTTTGDVYVWELSGHTIVSQGYLYQNLPLVWQIVGIGDFNGDCRSDILWRNTATGDVVLWLIDGLTIQSTLLVDAALPLVWQVAGVGDVNGDGMADIVWRNTQTGDVVLWEMNGGAITQQAVLSAGLAAAWQLAGVGDFNGDTVDELLWRNSQTGDVSLWQIGGTGIASQQLVANADLTWQLVGVGDLNGDGNADVVWRNMKSGAGYLWEMNGASIATQGYLFRGLPLVWQMQAP